MIFDQQEFDVRCEWGVHGVSVLAPISDVVIIVDVLSFSTCVDIAVNRGAMVYPYSRNDDTALAYADSIGAILADPQRALTRFSLSPESLVNIPEGTKIVLPSPNGSTLSLAAKPTPVLAGCFRNAPAVANAASKFGQKIAVIPAGERWRDDNSLRPSYEDLVGAGAIISHLRGFRSPESQIAVASYNSAEFILENALRQCSSGKELIDRGFMNDVILASKVGVSDCAPILIQDSFFSG